MAPTTLPALSPRLAQYVAAVRRWCAAGDTPVDADRLAALSAHAAALVAEPLELRPDQRVLPAAGYGRNLLYEDPDYGFVVLAMVWPGGISGSPHDHGTWGVVAVAEGQVEVEDYAVVDAGERWELASRGTIVGGIGATATVLPPDHDVHRVGNAAPDRVAVSIHTYGRSLGPCRVIDPSGEVRWVEPVVHNVAG